MSESPYDELTGLVERVGRHAQELAQYTREGESLAQVGVRDELRVVAEQLAGCADELGALLDWVEASDLPPGLRSAVEAHDMSELGPQGRPVGSPGEHTGPLPALAYVDELGGTDDVFVDVDDLEPGTYVPGELEQRRRDRVYPDVPLVRLRGISPLEDLDAGPREPAAFYFDASGARRVAALLRQAAARVSARGNRP